MIPSSPTIEEIDALSRAGQGGAAFAAALTALQIDPAANAPALLRAALVSERHEEAASALSKHRAAIDPLVYAQLYGSLALLGGDIDMAHAQATEMAGLAARGRTEAALTRIAIEIAIAERRGDPAAGLALMREREALCHRHPFTWLPPRWVLMRQLGHHEAVIAQTTALEPRIPATHEHERRLVRTQRALAHQCATNFHQATTIALELVADVVRDPGWAAPRPADIRIGTRQRQHAVFADIERLAIETKAPFALMAGTLLWLIRDGEVNANDTDMDLAVIPPMTSAALADILIGSGKFQPMPRELDLGAFRSLGHTRTGLAIDIIEYEADGDRLISTWRHPCGMVLRRSAVPKFTIRPTFHPGVQRQLPLPDNPEAVLTATYGDWRVPDPNFDSVIASPAVMEVTDYLIGTAAIRLADAMMNGWSGKAAHLAGQLLGFGLGPYPLQQVIEATRPSTRETP